MKRTVVFSKNAVNIFFHILTKCNLSCQHCYINPDQHGNEILPLETTTAWLKALLPTDKDANLIFLGGEPTLHPDLSHAVKSARKMGYSSITIDTNGYLFHDILNRVSPEEVDFFSFSLDGATPETNDRIRGTGCFNTCIDGIHRSAKKGFHTSLIYTVSTENIDELELMPQLLKGLPVERFFMQVIGLRGRSARAKKTEIQVDREAWASLIPDVAKKVANLGIIVTYPKVYLSESDLFECAGIVADNYFIFPNGRVYRCPLCEDYPIHSLEFVNDRLLPRKKINEANLFSLTILEGCVMNKLVQGENLIYQADGKPEYRIACCLLKEEVSAG